MSWTIYKTILVPYDFSEHSHSAVEKAMQLVADRSQIHILHVLPPFHASPTHGLLVDDEAVNNKARIEYAQKLLAGDFQDPLYSRMIQEVLIGDPGTICVDRAASLEAELIVIPSHGRSGVSRLLLGSVTERIVRLAACPVLVMKLSV
jgi:nucleotide-binding universal stress UspA family protein